MFSIAEDGEWTIARNGTQLNLMNDRRKVLYHQHPILLHECESKDCRVFC